MQEPKESGRIRKPSSKYENEIVADDNAVEAIRAFQKDFRKKKVPSEAHATGPRLPPPAASAPATKRQRGSSEASKKLKNVPAPVISAKDKALNEAEERLINAALERKTKASQAVRTLPEGAVEVADLNAAVKRAVRESCSMLLDWTTKEAMMVGSLCKVYWDGEHQWFYARILNYDSKYDRHYIYYYEDSTAEWISLQNESVLIGDRLVLAKSTPNAMGWPSLHYWASPLALPRQRYFKGYIRGAAYCEYYSETGLMDWGFMVPERIQPIQEEFMPKKMTKKYEAALHKAQEEQETNDNVLETVLKAVRDNVYNALIGEQWIGLRVRASTHSVFSEGADLASSSSSSDGKHYSNRRHHTNGGGGATAEAMCTGTVIHYCGVSNQHFIVFDDEGLQPQWVTAQKGVVDVLIGPGETLPPSAASEIALRTAKAEGDCALCGLSVLNEDGTLQSSDVKHCRCCSLVCHGYCTPLFTSYALENEPHWTCWNCNVCFGCGVNAMKTELMSWNGKRTEPELGDDRNLLLCGDCMLRYKHTKDFCSICLKLYATDDSMLPYQAAPPTVPAAVAAAAPVASADASSATNGTPEKEVLCQESAAASSPKKLHWRTQKRNAKNAAAAKKELDEAGEAEAEAITTAEGISSEGEKPSESVLSVKQEPETEIKTEAQETIEALTVTAGESAMDVVVPPTDESAAGVAAPSASAPVESNGPVIDAPTAEPALVTEVQMPIVEEENMVQCNECARWVHAECEGIDQTQYDAMTLGTHPVWGDEYLCPLCRIKLGHLIINTLQNFDSISMFANPVTTAVAKNYFDVIGNPMDLSKMKSKCAKGQYKSLQTLRQDFELMCLNAIVFNQAGDEYWQHARYFHERVQHQFNTQARLSHISAYGFELNQLIEQYNAKVAAEAKADAGKGGKQKNKRGVNGEASETAADKRIKVEGSSSASSDDHGADASDTLPNGELSESARLALLSSSMLPSALVAVTTSEEMDAIDKENEANKLMSALDIILPTTRAPCPDPHSFMACAVMVQSSEEAFYTCCMDTCLLCGSAGSSAMFLYCVDCGEAVHSFCADAPLVTMSEAVRVHWRCMNCKICEKCGSATEAEESSLIYCERCDRAYHIGCLDPCMPAVPQSRWFCNECVDCTTCKISAAEGSTDEAEPAFKSWGFEFDKCQFCTNKEEREKQRLQNAANEAHAQKIAERMKQQRQLMLNVYLCNICEVDCSDCFLVCRNCGQNSHPRCNPTSCSSWSKERVAIDFMCEHCLERMKNQPSHLGKGDKAAQLLSAVASIQRARWVQQSRVTHHKTVGLHQVILDHITPLRHLYLAVLQWAAIRITRLERDNVGMDVIISRPRDNQDLRLHYWVRTRAYRFYCLWRRVNGKSKTELQTFRSNMIKGYDARGAPLDTTTLARYATMASTFICATGAEMHPERMVMELTPIVNDMIAKFPITRKLLGDVEPNSLNDVFMGIMTADYDEIAAESARNGDSAPADSTAAKSTTSSSLANGENGAASKKTDEVVEERTRVLDLIRLVKSVQSVLMCGPIGQSGPMPENINHSVPLNVMRTNLTGEDAVVGEDYWNQKFHSMGVVSASPAAENVSENPASAERAAPSASGPVFNPLLGFPSTILENLRVTNALPGNLVRTGLLYNGSRISANVFNPNTPAGYSHGSGDTNSSAFFGRVEGTSSSAATAAGSDASTFPKRKGLRGAAPPPQPVVDGALTAEAGVTAKPAKVNFAAAMGKHLDSVVSVSLYAGDNHFAKKARLQRLGVSAEYKQEDNEPVQFFKAQDLEICMAAETARGAREKLHRDTLLAKEEEQRRLLEDEKRRRDQMIAEALLLARETTLAKMEASQEEEKAENGEVKENGAATEAVESSASTDEATPMEIDNSNNDEVENKPAPEIAEAAVEPAEEAQEDKPAEEDVDNSSAVAVAAEASTTAATDDAVSVTAVSIAEGKSAKDVSVTSGSGTGTSSSRHRSTGSVAAASNGRSSSRAAATAATTALTKRSRVATALWKNYVADTTAVEKVVEDLPPVASECGLQVPSESFSYPYCMEVSEVREDRSKRCTQTLPLRGWSDLPQLQQQPWQDPRVCYLCHVQTENHFYGRLLAFSDGIYAHANCLRWSSDVTERGGVLYDCDKATERSVVATCHYCHLKGATVSCMNRKKCGRIYHLKCAAVVNCVFLECKGSAETSEQSEFDVHSVILCAEHAGFVLEKPDRPFRKWLPQDPNRRLLLEDNLDTTVPEVSEMMSMKRGNKIVRSGGLSILSIGDPRIDLPDFHTTQYLYPYHFKSARIFWSMFTPLQRTMYVFEIFSEVDFESLPRSQSDYIQSCLEYYKDQGGDLYDHGSTNSPVFRILSLDNAQRPMYIKSIHQAYDLILAGVAECNESHRRGAQGQEGCFRKRVSLDAYGLNAHQFFGLGQSFVRRAIELIPESTAAMVALPPHPQYAPSFKLPTEADGRRIHRLQLAAKMTGAMSVNGCVRADGYVAGATRPMGVRITKMLTKVASDEPESEGRGSRSKNADPDEEAPTFAVDEEREENRREIEYNRMRYLEMSAAYLKDPNAKLEVQKSRIHGWGLFARINFERNDIIVEYIGEKVRAVIADRREAMYEDEGVGSCYLFRLDKDDIVDATKTGGMARFMNHCCEPNAYARIISSNDPSPGVPENKHIVIIAARDIQEGEEITYDYKFPIEEKKLKCYCGALKCQGSMN